jgi:stage V sporulation protein AC
MTNKEYDVLIKDTSPKTNSFKNCSKAFIVGGLICTLGQILMVLFKNAGLSEEDVKIAVPVTLIALSAITTGLQLYDNLATIGGAGTLVPITGFANAMVSPAIEFKTEGKILGIGAKMFSIVGPVLIYGITASFIYGLVLYLFKLV